MMLIWSSLYYLSLAQFSQQQIHSVVHAVNAFLLTSLLFWRNGIELLSWNVADQLQHMNDPLTDYACEHSLGYFLADSLDIVGSAQEWRRRYLWHHGLAIAGISTVYLGVTYSTFAIWCLELGGIVHHTKRLAPSVFTSLLYFVVYGFSRIYFAVILFTLWWFQPNATNLICFTTSLALTVQNFIWLATNLLKSL